MSAQKLGRDSWAFATGLVPDGWVVMKDVAPTFDLVVAALRPRTLRSLLVNDCVEGDDVAQLAVDVNANWGMADGQRILDQQADLSSEFDGSDIPLSGTILCDPNGDIDVFDLDNGWSGGRYIGYLRQDDVGHWRLRFGWFDGDWEGDVRFATRE